MGNEYEVCKFDCQEFLQFRVTVDGAKLAGKPEGKRPLEGHRRRWKISTKISLMGAGYECAEWI